MSSKKEDHRISYTFTHGSRFAHKENMKVDVKGESSVGTFGLTLYMNISKLLRPEDAARGRVKITFAGKEIVKDMLVVDMHSLTTSPTFNYVKMYSRKHRIADAPLIEYYIPEVIAIENREDDTIPIEEYTSRSV